MALFTEDSDDDSIATTTTAESKHSWDAGFNVEQILAEVIDQDDGKDKYLVKWEGYLLGRSTWESRDQFDTGLPFVSWKETKRKAAAERTDLFDLETYYDAVKLMVEEKEEKVKRRAAKRRKRREVSGSLFA